jgi:hypothetical protein
VCVWLRKCVLCGRPAARHVYLFNDAASGLSDLFALRVDLIVEIAEERTRSFDGLHCGGREWSSWAQSTAVGPNSQVVHLKLMSTHFGVTLPRRAHARSVASHWRSNERTRVRDGASSWAGRQPTQLARRWCLATLTQTGGVCLVHKITPHCARAPRLSCESETVCGRVSSHSRAASCR